MNRLCSDCGGIVGPWLEEDVADPDAFDCLCHVGYDEMQETVDDVPRQSRHERSVAKGFEVYYLQ